jgi:hypothetical protein
VPFAVIDRPGGGFNHFGQLVHEIFRGAMGFMTAR